MRRHTNPSRVCGWAKGVEEGCPRVPTSFSNVQGQQRPELKAVVESRSTRTMLLL